MRLPWVKPKPRPAEAVATPVAPSPAPVAASVPAPAPAAAPPTATVTPAKALVPAPAPAVKPAPAAPAVTWMLPRTGPTTSPDRARGRHYNVAAGPGAVRRLVFEAPKNCQISKDSALAFTFHSPNSPDLAPDILRGDRGYPELRLINAHGTIYRFKRGNLKDFFDLRRPNTPQRVHLPLASFLYDVDWGGNVPEPPDFFSQPLRKVLFDFLAHPERDIDVCVADVALEPHAGQAHFDALELLNVENLQHTPYLPKVVTYEPQLILSLQLNALGQRLIEPGSVLHWALSDAGATLAQGELKLAINKQTLRLDLPRFGGYALALEIRHGGNTIAAAQPTVVRAVPAGAFVPTKFGLSDADQFDKIAALGGTYERTILNLASVIKFGGRYRFKPNGRTLPLAPPPRGRRRIISLKGMPKFLSRRPELPDHHRYGALDWAEYRAMMEWLAGEIAASGGWAIEVWNEASVRHEWNDDLDQLVELHRISAEAIRAAAPGLVVLSGSTNTWDPEFLRSLMAHGAWAHCDALAVHGYTYAPQHAGLQFDEIEAICRDCAALKGTPFPCYVTEIGFRTPAFMPQAQAEQLVHYSLEAASRPAIEALVWFRFMNPRGEIGSNYDQHASGGYAMLGHGGRYARPSLAAYRFLIETLGGCAPLGRRPYSATGGCAYVFTGPAAHRLVIASHDPSGRHAVPPAVLRGLTMFDLYGNRLVAPAGEICYLTGSAREPQSIQAWLGAMDEGPPESGR